MANTAGTFVDPKTGKRKAFDFGTQPQGWSLEEQAPSPPTPLPANSTGADFMTAIQERLASGPAAQKYSDASQDYQSGLKNQSAFADALKLALQGADTETADLKNQRRSMIEGTGNLPVQMRGQLIDQGVTDPFARRGLINERYGARVAGAGNLQDEITRKGGSLQDIINSGTGAYQSNLQAQNAGLQDLGNQAQTEQNVLSDWYNDQRSQQNAKDLYQFQQDNKAPTGGGEKPPTTTEIKNSLTSDINGFSGLIATMGEEGQQPDGSVRISREQAAQDLFELYKEDGFTLEDIKKKIYDAYPDGSGVGLAPTPVANLNNPALNSFGNINQ